MTTRSYCRDLSETFVADRTTRPGGARPRRGGRRFVRLPDAEGDPQRGCVPGSVGCADDDPVQPGVRELRTVDVEHDPDVARAAERRVERRRACRTLNGRAEAAAAEQREPPTAGSGGRG